MATLSHNLSSIKIILLQPDIKLVSSDHSIKSRTVETEKVCGRLLIPFRALEGRKHHFTFENIEYVPSCAVLTRTV